MYEVAGPYVELMTARLRVAMAKYGEQIDTYRFLYENRKSLRLTDKESKEGFGVPIEERFAATIVLLSNQMATDMVKTMRDFRLMSALAMAAQDAPDVPSSLRDRASAHMKAAREAAELWTKDRQLIAKRFSSMVKDESLDTSEAQFLKGLKDASGYIKKQ